MYRIVKSNPKTKKELRRERVVADTQPRSTLFSVYFTRGMLVLCLILLGTLIGMKISEKQSTYEQGRWLLRNEERLVALSMYEDEIRRKVMNEMEAELLAEKGRGGPAPTVGTPTPATAQTAYQPQIQPNPNFQAANPAPIQPAQPRQPITSTSAELDRQLAAIREEREMIGAQLEGLKNPNALPANPQPRPQPQPNPNADNIASSALEIQAEELTMVEAPPKLSATEQRILDAPAVARVVKYDDDWQFVVLDGGSNRNIAPGTKFAVRRGPTLICEIQVEDVEPDYCTANLIGQARRKPDAPKPQKDDDVIGYPLF